MTTDLPVFTVGDATAERASALGFGRVVSADGDVEALARLIAAHGLTGPVLHPSARTPAKDLGALLAPAGVEVRAVAVYETRSRHADRALDAVRSGSLDAVLVHSPRAAVLVAEQLGELGLSLTALAISEAAAAALAPARFLAVRVADAPREDALLALVTGDRTPPFATGRSFG
jgi:uroporphyrinogen-III synthase